ncbi:methyl-accepting chemotaxis protein [Sphingomonas sp. AOB5]|uniref:methyl-accepting chemotaxis protein n=1 Tax=Sphingomonas sp. AOB5 TaxID=3034017 RepID=UPI0023F94B6F|nr:methyl-accepting chemotaxis protein [Sphingomonas sp. AOB5]MDF7777291.1 methyl-accepting chemotaxis protein [Sphingomonas sp. AOB5]
MTAPRFFRDIAPPGIGDWLTESERRPPSLTVESRVVEAIELFQGDTELRLIPVVDPAGKPIGAVFEKDIRKLLLNPFGHALMRNPAYGNGIARHIRPCPVAEASLDPSRLIDQYRAANGSEGMILTQGGRLFGVVANRRLVHLAAENELRAAHDRIGRAEQIERASERFEAQVAALSGSLSQLSGEIERNAGSTAERAGALGDRAIAVATAASQTNSGMAEIAERGRGLVAALGEIGRSTTETRAAASDASQMVARGSARAQELLRAAQSIDSVIALISGIAGQVNLLALNATIEAARAGEAGRGFTVVANEVKQLSAQTGSAAARITAHVRDICLGIDEVAQGHAQIEQAIEAMAALASTVQSAVQAQEHATITIARNVDDAVDASTGIQHDVEAIGDTSRTAATSAEEMRSLAKRLQSGAGALSNQVDAFLDEVRVA